ncbi:OTU domain-containing protein DDB_G0284757-like [Orbicella faveolata]|uniref:OTU domain-containing protein DDB_G0284757-like n=1 Tax=Orbicella faveolata TaxID=48498 RepID=UPI0009E5D476|nr:OTU domain-containing protein DDB_G0284757-like [Orbicella faveolata]
MLNCQTHDLSHEKSLKRENTKEESESVTVPEQYIDACIRKTELQNKHGTPFQASKTRLSNLNRTAIDVGGGGDSFFRAVSHQLYGNPNNHFYLRSVGVQYLVHNPEQFIESNTEHSWQDYLQSMSNQGTWADAIIIQAVANCLNLSIYIIESNPAFSPATVVESMNVTHGSLKIYIGHVHEIHYVPTSEMQRRYSNSETNIDKNLNQGAQERK